MKKKKLHPLLIAVIVLLILMLVLCGTVAFLWFAGRSALNTPATAPTLPPSDASEGQTEGAETGTAQPDGDYVEYNGKRYEYNKKMYNILLMGIDSSKNADEAAGERDQADVLILAALDQKANKLSLINISRDTMCDMKLVDANGEQTGMKHAQLALAYAYGDGQHLSCKLTRDAVSNLFYGLPIHNYAAYYVKGVSQLNDAVGGVTVTVRDDYDFTQHSWLRHLKPGSEVTLKGKEAQDYIQLRNSTIDGNNQRMQRQKQYMLALISKAKNMMLENPTCVFSIYNAVDDYILTDLNISEISYLATIGASMDFSGNIRSLIGEMTLTPKEDDIFVAELHPNQEQIYDLIMDIFYTEVP